MLNHTGGDPGKEPDSPRLTTADEGKDVVTATGKLVGTVVRVDVSAAHVCPREGLLDGCGSWLSSPWSDCELFELDTQAVGRVTDEAVVLMPQTTQRNRALREIDEPFPER